MSKIANPMKVLISLQHSLDAGMSIDPADLDSDHYKFWYDVRASGKRYAFTKIVDGKAHAIAIFCEESPINGLACLNIGYAVAEELRGKGLAIEAVNKGVAWMVEKLGGAGQRGFYIEAVVGRRNEPSINVARKLFANPPQPIIETESGEHALQFLELVEIGGRA